MKVIARTITAVAVAGLIISSLPVSAGNDEERQAKRAEARANLIEELNLSAEQQVQVEAIFTAKDARRAELFESARDADRETRREVREQMKTLRGETDIELQELLGEAQFSRLEELREEHRKDKPGGRRGGHRRGRGGNRG